MNEQETNDPARSPLGDPPPTPDEAVVIRHEEDVTGTSLRWRGIGHVRARKRVETLRVDEVLSRNVEDATFDRVPAEEDDAGGICTLDDGTISIPVYEERLVVTKQIVLKERILIRKKLETISERVRDELRREQVEIDADDSHIAG
ncbi:MAG TPA: DUF2382 domain-containing protein [Gaiellaceae bacterium]|jgi:uncharacterized protein (TIGR02271 family)|nr:DUF2382 domain-containing protein [Gaiellaceae bacterium]